MKILLAVFVVIVLALISSSVIEILPWSISSLIILCAFTAAYLFNSLKARN
jgi:hypothetical protein